MSKFEGGAIQVEVVQELRELADRGADVPELVELLLRRLELEPNKAVFPVDSILIPAMHRTISRWQKRDVMPT